MLNDFEFTDRESINVCPTGRVMRYIELIGLIDNLYLVPDHVVKETILDHM